MSQLDPELRRLIRWSGAAREQLPEEAPFGVAARMAGHLRKNVAPDEPAWWPRLQLVAAWLSVAILVAGGTIWATRLHATASAYDFTPAYQLIAQNIAP